MEKAYLRYGTRLIDPAKGGYNGGLLRFHAPLHLHYTNRIQAVHLLHGRQDLLLFQVIPTVP